MQRWGIVGTSRISHDFARALKRTPGSTLHAVVSRDPANARRFAGEHGAATAHNSMESFLADPEFNVAYLAAPTGVHHALGLAVLGAQKHLLCEKPFTSSVSQAGELVTFARERSLFCMEAMWLRFNAAIRQCREDLAAGRLGRLSLMAVEIGYRKNLGALGGVSHGQGANTVFGCYGLSIALFLFGSPKDHRVIRKQNESGVDIETAYLLDYGDHIVSIVASIGTTLSNELRIYGSKARIVVPAPFLDATERLFVGNESSVWTRRFKTLYDPLRRRLPTTTALLGSGLRGEVSEVARCLENGLLESPSMPLEQTLAVHRLMAE